MSNEAPTNKVICDLDNLPKMFPTHRHEPVFWEHLGRTIASFGFLEEVLGKAIFAFTAMQEHSKEEFEATKNAWEERLKKALTDTLRGLADVFRKATHDYPDVDTEHVSTLVEEIEKAADYRNALCHGSWRAPDANGASIPLFVNRNMEIFETPIDVEALRQTQTYVAELSCRVVDTVTQMGWQFPGGEGPGERIL